MRITSSGMFAVTALALLAGAPQQRAQKLLVDPTGGTVLSSVNDDDSVYGGRALGFSGSFFGTAHTTVDVCSNGHLNFSGDNNYSNGPMPGGPAHINALWDDLFVYGGQSITEKVNPGVYYSVTWDIGTYNFGHVHHIFQAVWFGAATTIGRVDFLPNDIAFCYESVGADPWDATVGLDSGSGAFVPLPGDADGFFDQTGRALLPVFPRSGKIILFRPAGSSYTAIDITAGNGCQADFNHDGQVNVGDFLAFLAAYSAGCP
jgi:hypothetical protein